MLDESEIIDGLLVGDEQAAESFVRQHQPRIQRAVREAGIPSADVPDVTQEILLAAIRQLSAGQFERRSTLQTWLRQIVQGRIVDYWRAAGRRGLGKLVSIDAIDGSNRSFVTPAAQEARLLTEEALGQMPVRHRLAIRAHCRNGVQVEELARLFGLSVKRTYGIIAEAKDMFRQHVRGREKTPSSRRLQKQGDKTAD